jgi:O-antigen/teichoic acid export membrane protein
MNNSLSRDTFFYSLAKWGQRLSTILIAPFVITYFSPQQYGYMSLITTLGAFFSMLGMLAIIDQGLPRFFIDSTDINMKQSYATTSFVISGIGMLVVTGVILTSYPLIPMFFDEIKAPFLFCLLTALVGLAHGMRHVGGNMLKWTFQSELFTRITLFQALLTLCLIILGIIVWDWRANAVLFVSSTITLLCGAWAISYCKQFFKLSAFSKIKSKELFAFSWPLLGLNIFAFFTRSLDRLFLAGLTSLGTVGIFSVASAIASVFETLVAGFFFAWGPFILSTFRKPESPQHYADFFGVTACIGLMNIAILGFWGSPIVMLLRPEGTYVDIGIYIPWIVSGTLLYYLGGYFTPGPSITKKTYWKFIGFVLAAIINAILNYLLIPQLGILGAGLATTIASLVAATFNIIISNRLYFIPLKWQLSFILILLYATAVSYIQHTSNSYLPIYMRFLATGCLIGFAFFLYYKDIQASGILQKFHK